MIPSSLRGYFPKTAFWCALTLTESEHESSSKTTVGKGKISSEGLEINYFVFGVI
jgi:hypothetical protein